MKQIMIYILCFASLFMACGTERDWTDTGIASPYHDCSIMDYLREDTMNWQLTVVLIEEAGLEDLFEGKNPDYEEITFFAPPSFSILRYIWDEKKEAGEALTPEELADPRLLIRAHGQEWCKKMVMRHVLKGKHLKESFAFRNKEYAVTDPKQDGCTDVICEDGNMLRVYRESSDYGGVPDAGPVTMYIYSYDAMMKVPLACPDIQPLNGVVHALNYNYLFGNI